MNGRKTKKDQLGLVDKWYTVPKSAARPEGAVNADREEVRQKVMYVQQKWAGQNTGWPLRRRDRKPEGESNEEGSDTAKNVV
jgi:hypothetical protein